MAYTTLNSLLKAIANAIRSKKGTTDIINAQNFPSEIASILKGSGNAKPSDVLRGKTFTNNSGEQTGTMPTNENGTNTSSSGKDNEGAYFYIPYGYYPEYANGKAWVRSDQSQITNLVSISVASKFEQRNYQSGFYAELDLGSVKTCYKAQAFSGDSEGSKQYVTPQYQSNGAWVNYTGGTVAARYWRGQMVGSDHIGNFASVLVAYAN